MASCEECGSQNEEAAIYCRSCGEKIKPFSDIPTNNTHASNETKEVDQQNTDLSSPSSITKNGL